MEEKPNSDTKKQIEFFKKKSIEAFLMSIEIFNKPTIEYRLEGCVFFLCNAWELLIKAKLLEQGISIYYPDKKGISRTINLSEAIAKVMTNDKDPIRQNLRIVASIRNMSTHSVIPEYEILYTPFLSFSAQAYADKLYEYFQIKIGDYISNGFLTLFNTNKKANKSELLSKYGEGIQNLFYEKQNELNKIIKESDMEIAQAVEVKLVRINNKSKANFSFYMSNNNMDQHAKKIETFVDYNTTHPYTHHQITNKIDSIIKESSIAFDPIRYPEKEGANLFTTACLDVILKAHNLKGNTEYCAAIENGTTKIYKYSDQLITYVITLISSDKTVVKSLHEKYRKR